uniref:Uncharacterized protein n=1 Tax=Glossina pallidipes TaxID=7398 RepID=A0A1A9Z9T6_GLOPL
MKYECHGTGVLFLQLRQNKQRPQHKSQRRGGNPSRDVVTTTQHNTTQRNTTQNTSQPKSLGILMTDDDDDDDDDYDGDGNDDNDNDDNDNDSLLEEFTCNNTSTHKLISFTVKIHWITGKCDIILRQASRIQQLEIYTNLMYSTRFSVTSHLHLHREIMPRHKFSLKSNVMHQDTDDTFFTN